MTDPTEVLADSNPVDDVADADLGDKRRNDRYVQIVDAVSHRPDSSVPEALEDGAEQEGYYRFVRNPNVDDEALFEPHFEATAERAEKLDEVLCIHDTTEFSFPVHDDTMRKHLARPSTNRQGFLWHASLVCSADRTRAPLGLVETQAFVHETDLEDEESVDYWNERGGLYDNEKWRWFDSIETSDHRLEDVECVIHVMDREFDDFQLLFCMDVDGYEYVARLCYDRNVCTGERRSDYEKLHEALGRTSWRGKRTVQLSARSASQASRTHPVRRSRKATVQARYATVKLRRPDSIQADHAPNQIEVNVVEVRETNPPSGEEPVHWILVTTRPVYTAEKLWKVVDHYRSRWTVEEYFKAIKTGCDYTSLQHRSAKTLLCALAATAVVAHHLLVLRYLGRNAGDLPAKAVVTDVQLQVLEATKPDVLSATPTAHEAMTAVANLGGHIKSNGDPGWQVLGRGYERLLEYEHAFALGMQAQAEK